jgi:hypothetical protein
VTARGWHQLFSAGLKVIAYDPLVRLTRVRALGVLGAFAVSGAWHAVQLYVLLPSAIDVSRQADSAPPGGPSGAWRTFWFFTLNGLGCMIDGGVLRRIPHATTRKVVRRTFAWLVLWNLAAWTARAWPSVRGMCRRFLRTGD